MTLQLVRPSSLPYALTGDKLALYLATYSGIASTLAPTVAGGGSLSDDSDSTGVTLRASQDSGGDYVTSVVGVDFAPISGSITGSFDTMFRLARVMTQIDFGHPDYTGSEWLLIYGDTPTVGGSGAITDAMPYLMPSQFNSIPDVQTTWETTDGSSAWIGADAATITGNGFTLAFSAHITTDAPTDVFDVFNVTEVGLYIDIESAAEPAPLRIYPRSRTRIYPRRRTRRPGTF